MRFIRAIVNTIVRGSSAFRCFFRRLPADSLPLADRQIRQIAGYFAARQKPYNASRARITREARVSKEYNTASGQQGSPQHLRQDGKMQVLVPVYLFPEAAIVRKLSRRGPARCLRRARASDALVGRDCGGMLWVLRKRACLRARSI